MSVVAAYHVFVCALFLVQGGLWTGYGHLSDVIMCKCPVVKCHPPAQLPVPCMYVVTQSFAFFGAITSVMYELKNDCFL